MNDITRYGESSARFDILAVLGGYVVERTDEVWLGALIELLDAAGTHERAVRAQAQRMSAEGWFEVERVGRRSRYRLTEQAKIELISGDLRVLEDPQPSWNECWTVVIYEIPADRRADRDRLRVMLQWLGFGQLTAGTWISPHPRLDEARSLIDRLELGGLVTIVPDAKLVGASAVDHVRRSWNLDELRSRYQETAELLARQDPDAAAPRAAFAQDMILLKDLLSVLRIDPNLPHELLPPDWPGTETRAAVANRRGALRTLASTFVSDVLQRHQELN